jgi:hypothetical protein
VRCCVHVPAFEHARCCFQCARLLTCQPIDDRCQYGAGGLGKTRPITAIALNRSQEPANQAPLRMAPAKRRCRMSGTSEPDIEPCNRKPGDAHGPRLPWQIARPDWYREFQCGMSAELVYAGRGYFFLPKCPRDSRSRGAAKSIK